MKFKMIMRPGVSQRMSVKRVLIVSASVGLAAGIIAAMIFILNIGDVRRAFASSNTYYSIKSGNWESPSTWSTTGYTGAAATNFPQAGDIVNIQGCQISVANQNVACGSITVYGSGKTNAQITVSNGKSLTTSSNIILNGANTANYADITLSGKNSSLIIGGSFTATRSSATAALKLTMNPYTIVSVSGNLSLTSSGGGGGISLTMDTSSSLSVGGNLNLIENGNTGSIFLSMKNKATATIKDTTFLNYVSGKGGAYITMTTGSVLNAWKDIRFSADTFSKAYINCIGATISAKGNLVRQPAPNDYGKLNCTGGANLIFSGTSPQVFPMGYAPGKDTFKYDTVIINNTFVSSPQITLQGGAVIAAGMKFIKGIVQTTSANMLTLSENCIVSGMNNASFIDGPVTKQCNTAFTFPTGKGGKLGLISISKPSAITTFTAEYFYSPFSNTKSFDNTLSDVSTMEYWSLTKTSGSATTIVSLIYNNAQESGITNGKNMVVASWNPTTKLWQNYGNAAIVKNNSGILVDTAVSANADSSTITATQKITPNGFFTFGSISGNNPLPVTLLNFTATPSATKTHLSWSTATEINNNYFDIQRSNDGKIFSVVGNVKGAGNSTQELNYSYDDFNPQIGLSYYRLKQVDYNGNFVYSPVIEVNSQGIGKSQTTIGPNPFTSSFRVSFSQDIAGTAEMLIANLAGQVVYREAISAAKGENNFEFNDNIGLPSGIYFLQLTKNGGDEETHKIIKY